MSGLNTLLENYRLEVGRPWLGNLAPPQRVWLAIYEPPEERRIRILVHEFELATRAAGKTWVLLDLTDLFGQWMGSHRYREAYFESPELLPSAIGGFEEHLADHCWAQLEGAGPESVVAVLGAGSLYGLTQLSTLLDKVAPAIEGRLLLFFPGSHEGQTYRLLNARDGLNYLSVPITS